MKNILLKAHYNKTGQQHDIINFLLISLKIGVPKVYESVYKSLQTQSALQSPVTPHRDYLDFSTYHYILPKYAIVILNKHIWFQNTNSDCYTLAED